MLSAICFLAVTLSPAHTEVLVKEGFEEQGKWKTAVSGNATADLVAGGVEGKCAKTVADGNQSYWILPLDPKQVAGKMLQAKCMVKLDDVRMGDVAWARAKIKFLIMVGTEVINRATLFDGTKDWHEQVVKAEVPEDATKVEFQMGIQNGSGTAYFDNLTIDDGLLAVMPVPLGEAANTTLSDGIAGDGKGGFLDLGRHDLYKLPQGEVELGGIPFRVEPSGPGGTMAIRLRGMDRPEYPAKTAKPIKVGRKGKALVFLHAAGWVDATRDAPCLFYDVAYEDGTKETVPVVEGQGIGAFDDPHDLSDCKLVWSDTNSLGKKVGVGVLIWRNPHPDKKIETILARSPGTGATPAVIGVSVDRFGQLLRR